MKFLLVTVLIFTLTMSLFSEENGSRNDLQGLKIIKIEIATKRVKQEYIRAIIPGKEGETFEDEDIENIRHRLNRMKFFKKIDITVEKDQNQNGVILNIKLEDGWFIFPLPFISAGGGGTNGSLMLVERNIFKRAESIFLFGGGNRDGGFGSAAFQLDLFSLSGNYAQRKFTEWAYTDGGFNSAGRFRSSRSEDNPEKFGAIQNQYEKNVEETGFQFRFPLNSSMSGTMGLSSQKISYTNLTAGVLPSDQGNINSINIGFNLQASNSKNMGRFMDSSFSFQDFGAVFGFGMADLNERIKPLSQIQTNTNIEFSVSESNRLLGSDFNFTKINLGAHPTITFKHRQRISFRVKGITTIRENISLSQKVATNRELGFRGNYAREYRGDRGAGSSLTFSYPFRRTRRGVWTGELFSDVATVWDSGRSFYKNGVGFGFGYQFWRFPLPLGLTYSYSLDDKDSQLNFAFGGRF